MHSGFNPEKAEEKEEKKNCGAGEMLHRETLNEPCLALKCLGNGEDTARANPGVL